MVSRDWELVMICSGRINIVRLIIQFVLTFLATIVLSGIDVLFLRSPGDLHRQVLKLVFVVRKEKLFDRHLEGLFPMKKVYHFVDEKS